MLFFRAAPFLFLVLLSFKSFAVPEATLSCSAGGSCPSTDNYNNYTMELCHVAVGPTSTVCYYKYPSGVPNQTCWFSGIQIQQVCEWVCPSGYSYNSVAESCVLNECPEGQSHIFINGSASCITCAGGGYSIAGTEYCGSCQDNGHAGTMLDSGLRCMPRPTDDCGTPGNPSYGTFNGQKVCNPDNSCPEGEKGGVVNGQFVCVPSTEEPPDCQPGTVLQKDTSGNWVCVPSTDTQPSPDPADPHIIGSDPAETPTNPNYSSGACDPSDPACQKNTNNSANSVSGGGTCAHAPVCSGDPVACANLYQTWKARCAFESPDMSLLDQLTPPADLFAAATAQEVQYAELFTALSVSLQEGGILEGIGPITGENGDVQAIANDFVSIFSAPTACNQSALTFTFPAFSIAIPCDIVATARAILAYVFYVLTAYFVLTTTLATKES